MFQAIKQFIRRALNAPGWEQRKKSPNRGQWGQFFAALTKRERAILLFGILLLFSGVGIFGTRSYVQRTEMVPANGGNVTVGVVGRPLYINPILAPSNAADSDLERLIFAGLFRYSPDGTLIPDLAESYAIGDFGKVIEVTLKEGVRWPNGEPFNADDVAFTIESIQDPAIRSPLLANWIGIDVEVISETTLRFTLPAPYPPFLHNLAIGILPKRTWEDVAPENFALSEQNIKPMGLGPFRPVQFERAKDGRILSYTLERNPDSLRQPLLDKITLRFFNQQQEALVAFNRREIQLLGPLTPADIDLLRSGNHILSAELPRIFGVFFNQANSKVLADDDVRMSLETATNRDPILELLGGASFSTRLDLPIPANMFGATDEAKRYEFNTDESIRILEEAEWLFPDPNEDTEDGDTNDSDTGSADSDGKQQESVESSEPPEDPIRENSDEEQLTFTLTHQEDPRAGAIAQQLQKQWELLGISIETKSLTAGAFRKAIIERDYQAILAGEELPLDPDMFAFWHSSQKFDPGGNLALFESPSVDAILEKGRESFVDNEREKLYQDAQKLIQDDAPAIFLWQERYSVAVDADVYGINFSLLANPSWRFANVDEWYVRTRRVWK